MNRLIQTILARFGYRLVRHGYLASSRFGIDPAFDVSRLVADDRLARFLPRRRIERVFDIGANVGDTALRFAEAFPEATIEAFEPIADTHAELVRRVGSHPRIRTHRLAFGAHTGDLTLNVFDGAVFASAVQQHAMMSAEQRRGVETVPVTTVDAWCASQAIEHIDLLKIDTEGFDLEVLRGARQMLDAGRIGFVTFEFFRVAPDVGAEDGGHLTALHQLLAAAGYRPAAFYTDFVHPEHSGGIFNALYVCWH